MPEVRPFSALQYDPALPSEAVLCPPYDAISPSEARACAGRGPFNAVRLVLPESPGAAAERLDRWCREGVLRSDPEPAYYWCRQAWRDGGRVRESAGLLALLRLAEPGPGGVFPHEETNARVREGQQALLRATRANFSPVMLLYRDRARRVEALAARLEAGQPPVREWRDDRGVTFTLRRLPVEPEIAVVFAGREAFIADGHHRYAAALAYYRETGPAAAWTAAYFLNSAVTGRVAPFHRYVPGAGAREGEMLRVRFGARSVPGLPELLAGLTPGVLGLAWADRYCLFEVPGGESPASVFLHREIIGPLLGRTDDELEYEASVERLADRLAGGGLALFLPPVDAEALRRVWAEGLVLPRKSTCFYPKIPSGLAIHRHAPAAAARDEAGPARPARRGT